MEAQNETELVIKNGRQKTKISECMCKLHDHDHETVNKESLCEERSCKSFRQPGRERQTWYVSLLLLLEAYGRILGLVSCQFGACQ